MRLINIISTFIFSFLYHIVCNQCLVELRFQHLKTILIFLLFSHQVYLTWNIRTIVIILQYICIFWHVYKYPRPSNKVLMSMPWKCFSKQNALTVISFMYIMYDSISYFIHSVHLSLIKLGTPGGPMS